MPDAETTFLGAKYSLDTFVLLISLMRSYIMYKYYLFNPEHSEDIEWVLTLEKQGYDTQSKKFKHLLRLTMDELPFVFLSLNFLIIILVYSAAF